MRHLLHASPQGRTADTKKTCRFLAIPVGSGKGITNLLIHWDDLGIIGKEKLWAIEGER